MWKYSLRTLLLGIVVLGLILAAARVGLRVSQPRLTVIYAMPRSAAESPAQSDFHERLVSFDEVILPWMRDRGYQCQGKSSLYNAGFTFEKNSTAPNTRGVRIYFMPLNRNSRDKYVEVELWDWVQCWQWETAPPIAPTDDERKLIGDLQALLESHFAYGAASKPQDSTGLVPTNDSAATVR